IASRQLPGDDAHRLLAKAHAAVVLRDSQAEDTDLAHLRDDLDRNQTIRMVPSLRARDDLAVSKPAQLVADRIERFVEIAVADGRLAAPAHQSDQPRPAVRPTRHQALERPSHAGGNRRRGQPYVGGPHDLALTHRDTAENLAQILAEPDLGDQLLGLAEPAGKVQLVCPGRQLADGFDIGREPGEAMGGALLAIERTLHGEVLNADPPANRGGC